MLPKVMMWSVVLAVLSVATIAPADERVRTDSEGRIVPVPLPIDERFVNPWPDEMEEGFKDRADHAIRKNNNKGGKYGNTYFENEKAAYPKAMLDFLNGNRAAALRMLQAEDNQAGSWNSQTAGIDFFPSFTLKGQMRKYFFFGQYLEPAYRARMRQGAKLWTAKDPMRRRTKYFKRGGGGWTPETKNSWVDVRNTDNLRAMRECAIYLMAEETGNDELASAYLEDIQRYVWALWNIGMGEWDSENYHAHTMTGYIQLYDFAKDPEAKMAAKAAMDMLSLMGAVKYYRGGFCGPIKRDYNKPYAFAGAAGELQLYFNDTPIPNPDPHHDHAHFVTSAYRPPPAVVKLAHKDFDQPVEILASKPTYETWKAEGGGSASKDYPAPNYWQADHKPAFFETTYIGDTFQLGSLIRGSRGDVNGLKMCMYNSEHGADFFVAAGGVNRPKKVNRGSGKDRVAQYKNLLVCRSVAGELDYIYLVPDSASVEQTGGVTFVKAERTWLAIRPIAGSLKGIDKSLKKPGRWKHCQFMSGRSEGFAMEVGEAGTHGSYSAFKRGVLDRGRVELDGSAVTFVGSRGRSVKIDTGGNGLPVVWRNGEKHNWRDHWPLYQNADGGKAPLHLGYKTGDLYVEAGGWVFEASFDHTGKYTFRNARK
jgi:hypothetical protein